MHAVHPFSSDTLSAACASAGRKPDLCAKRPHVQYLAGYLAKLGCQTIVVEDPYVDRDFLDDFAAFYVRCFEDYDRFCRRLHFFKASFNQEAYDNFIAGEGGVEPEALKQGYLGHVVLKPLPDAFLGRTCLATYTLNGRRHFPMTRSYTAHLAGLPLEVESLAFQEQDTVLAACATSAVWSALQKTGRLFEINIPTPAGITAFAAKSAFATQRSLPSRGLNVYQICQAIRGAGLDVEVREGENIGDLRGLLYGYGAAGLPSILGHALISEGRHLGFHAATVSGFSFSDAAPGMFRADRIDKLYLHDDQVGPFARSPITGLREFESPWTSSTGRTTTGRVDVVIIPVYAKIRIRYEEARSAILDLVRLLSHVYPDLEWDVRLSTVNDLRSEIAATPGLSPNLRTRVLAGNWPKYLWRATARQQNEPALEVVMDATDIHRAFFVEDVLFFNTSVEAGFRAALSAPAARDLFTAELGGAWVERIQNSLDA